MKRNFKISLALLCTASFTLSGCNTPPPEEILIGAWVEKSDDCASSFAWDFQRDGAYSEWGGQGRWSLEGDTLTINITEKLDPPDGDSTVVAVDETTSFEIVEIEKDHAKLASKKSGEIIELKRCPDPDSAAGSDADQAGSDLQIENILSTGPNEIFISCTYEEEPGLFLDANYRITEERGSIISFDSFDRATNSYLKNTAYFPGSGWNSERDGEKVKNALKGLSNPAIEQIFESAKVRVETQATEENFRFEVTTTFGGDPKVLVIFGVPAFTQEAIEINRATGALSFLKRNSSDGAYISEVVGSCEPSENQIQNKKRF